MIDPAHFWNPKQFAPNDNLNETIWAESCAVQAEIQPAEELRKLNAFGAQQWMIDPDPKADPPTTCDTVLPWVPDLLGKNWQAEGAILIVGSAYAGFTKEYSGGHGMHLRDYLQAQTPNQFRDQFVKQVVGGFRKYYGFVESLGEILNGPNATFADFALTDLCRASFVCRMSSNCEDSQPRHPGYVKEGRVTRSDWGGDEQVEAKPELYARYVESPRALSWTWQRLLTSSAGRKRIIALGRIAEHGLLRCFQAHPQHIRSIRSKSREWRRFRNPDRSDWARRKNYADAEFHLEHWLEESDWWTVTGNVNGIEREWRILPIKHSSQASVDMDAVKRVLELMSSVPNPVQSHDAPNPQPPNSKAKGSLCVNLNRLQVGDVLLFRDEKWTARAIARRHADANDEVQYNHAAIVIDRFSWLEATRTGIGYRHALLDKIEEEIGSQRYLHRFEPGITVVGLRHPSFKTESAGEFAMQLVHDLGDLVGLPYPNLLELAKAAKTGQKYEWLGDFLRSIGSSLQRPSIDGRRGLFCSELVASIYRNIFNLPLFWDETKLPEDISPASLGNPAVCRLTPIDDVMVSERTDLPDITVASAQKFRDTGLGQRAESLKQGLVRARQTGMIDDETIDLAEETASAIHQFALENAVNKPQPTSSGEPGAGAS